MMSIREFTTHGSGDCIVENCKFRFNDLDLANDIS